MEVRTVSFHFGLFWHAMINLLGREPDKAIKLGWDGIYDFRYEPKDKSEEERFARGSVILQEWLTLFELIPLRSRCEYGRLLQPRHDEEGKDYLCISIRHPVEKVVEGKG